MFSPFPVLSDADIDQRVQDIGGYVNRGSQLIAIGTRKELFSRSTVCTKAEVNVDDLRRYNYCTTTAKVPRESGYCIGDLNIVSTVQPGYTKVSIPTCLTCLDPSALLLRHNQLAPPHPC